MFKILGRCKDMHLHLLQVLPIVPLSPERNAMLLQFLHRFITHTLRHKFIFQHRPEHFATILQLEDTNSKILLQKSRWTAAKVYRICCYNSSRALAFELQTSCLVQHRQKKKKIHTELDKDIAETILLFSTHNQPVFKTVVKPRTTRKRHMPLLFPLISLV